MYLVIHNGFHVFSFDDPRALGVTVDVAEVEFESDDDDGEWSEGARRPAPHVLAVSDREPTHYRTFPEGERLSEHGFEFVTTSYVTPGGADQYFRDNQLIQGA